MISHKPGLSSIVRGTLLWLILSCYLNIPALSQSAIPISPSGDLIPNQNPLNPGVNPLQVAPDAKVDQLQQNQSTPQTGNQQMTEVLIQNALINTANRYPWIIDPTDRFTFSGSQFRPIEKEIYTNFDFQSIQDGPVINRVNLGHFARDGSFYWVGENNRVLIETQGLLGGIAYQGRSSDIYFKQTAQLVQSYGGYQFVIALPQDPKGLFPKNSNQSSSAILSIAGEIENPAGVTAPSVNLSNSTIDRNNPNLTVITIPNQNNLFSNLDISNAPLLLQAYPTTNLQALAEIPLEKGEIIPDVVLQEAGIKFGSVLLGKAPAFDALTSSLPGIKLLQFRQFDNPDLLRLLLDRSLDAGSKKLYYLNSLQWVPFGMRVTDQKLDIKSEQDTWFRLYVSRPHNRVMLQYDAETVGATFTQVFANPGISITLRQSDFKPDGPESWAASLGLMAGGLFEWFNPEDVNGSLQTARQHYLKGDLFTPLKTQATPADRRQINRRLNSTLAYTNVASGMEQLSGSLTLPSRIYPESSSLIQVRTGLHRRTVFFNYSPEPIYTAGATSFRNVRLSVDKMGPLGFSSTFVQSSTLVNNQSFAAQTLVTTDQGQQFLFEAASDPLVGVPIASKAFALAMDRFELTRTEQISGSNHSYSGALLLPALEFVFSGTDNNLNYSVGVGTWLNPNPHTGFNVPINQSRFVEPGIGVYANATLSYTSIDITRDAQNNPETVIVQTPSLLLRWNSAANSLNPNLAALRYTFSYQNRDLNFTIVPSLQYSNQASIILPSSLQLQSGLNLETYLELGNSFYYRMEALQDINPSLALGAYYRNFTDVANSRFPGYGYGLKVRYSVPTTSTAAELSLGNTNLGLEVRLQGSLSF